MANSTPCPDAGYHMNMSNANEDKVNLVSAN